jgi:hypothetical protein
MTVLPVLIVAAVTLQSSPVSPDGGWRLGIGPSLASVFVTDSEIQYGAMLLGGYDFGHWRLDARADVTGQSDEGVVFDAMILAGYAFFDTDFTPYLHVGVDYQAQFLNLLDRGVRTRLEAHGPAAVFGGGVHLFRGATASVQVDMTWFFPLFLSEHSPTRPYISTFRAGITAIF